MRLVARDPNHVRGAEGQKSEDLHFPDARRRALTVRGSAGHGGNPIEQGARIVRGAE
jgi:hypothetical protein